MHLLRRSRWGTRHFPFIFGLAYAFLALALGTVEGAAVGPAAIASVSDPPPGLVDRSWIVDGVERHALVHIPSGLPAGPCPVIFDFHGHGGTSRSAARSNFHGLWPEAVVLYPQGLPTAGMTDPLGLRSGWQQQAGDNRDRDLRFFDTMLASLREEGLVDESRIFCTGHSNGGRMTYLLWETRPAVFAAYAPSASPATKGVSAYRPRPAFVVGSPEDRTVPFAWQKASIDALLKVNGCEPAPEPWVEGCVLYASRNGNPLVTYIHHGGHAFPSDAPALIVRFFKLGVCRTLDRKGKKAVDWAKLGIYGAK